MNSHLDFHQHMLQSAAQQHGKFERSMTRPVVTPRPRQLALLNELRDLERAIKVQGKVIAEYEEKCAALYRKSPAAKSPAAKSPAAK